MAQRVPVSDLAGGSKRTSRVKVAVRLRPYMEKQQEKDKGACVRGLGPQSLEIINWRNSTETLQYQFDAFYGEQASQQEVFLGAVKPILPYMLNGQNASVFAYGPTGAGKTHTMLGTREQPGVIPRAVREVFQLVRAQENAGDDWDFTIGMSYLEIYNEKVLDLLSPSTLDLPIREDKDRNILIPGLTHITLSSLSEFHTHFIPASLNRTTASTKLNQRSSRSHAILLIKAVKTQRAPPHRQQTGKLYLVDLAGSEDNRRTGNQGLRLKESGAINLSLFTLSKVVDSLNLGVGRVPYRDSKLTRLLQDSLGGSAHSIMIANIAPEQKYYFDTFSALNFAAKSKLIVNKPFVRDTVCSNESGKRTRQEPGTEAASEPQKKKFKERQQQEEQEENPATSQPPRPIGSSVLSRLIALEQLLMGSPEKQRLKLLKTVDQSRKEIQELKEKQKELEKKAQGFDTMLADQKEQDQDSAVHPKRGLDMGPFKNNLPPLCRKQSTAARPRRQAVVTPLPVSEVQPLQQCAVTFKPSLCPSLKRKQSSKVGDGKENKENAVPDSDWESHLDTTVLERSREKILQILNSGNLKDLKSLQLIGDKKAKLIMGWREVHGQFSQVEDLQKIEGITAKRFSSFIKANILSTFVK